MTHVTCRLTAENRDQLRNPIRSVVEYGLQSYLSTEAWKHVFKYIFLIPTPKSPFLLFWRTVLRPGTKKLSGWSGGGFCSVYSSGIMSGTPQRGAVIACRVSSSNSPVCRRWYIRWKCLHTHQPTRCDMQLVAAVPTASGRTADATQLTDIFVLILSFQLYC